MTKERILLVDDQKALLDGLRRHLRRDFEVEAALGGHDALALIEEEGPFAVVVSDWQMPHMNGIEFLSTLREQAPDTVRIMLTGNADLPMAMEAVNDGYIFRLLNKPCAPEDLSKALQAGLEQYRLQMAPQELLEETLRGSLQVLSDILALVNPEAFGRSDKIQSLVREMAVRLELPNTWSYEVSAMLSQLGCLVLPEDILKKVRAGQRLDETETELFMQHPAIGADLLKRIPRMDEVVANIAYQEKHFDGTGSPPDASKGETIPIGARLLKVALDFESLESAGMAKTDILSNLTSRTGMYDPSVLDALQFGCPTSLGYEECEMPISQLEPDYILAEELKSSGGALIAPQGQKVTPALMAMLANYVRTGNAKATILVLVPISDHEPQPAQG